MDGNQRFVAGAAVAAGLVVGATAPAVGQALPAPTYNDIQYGDGHVRQTLDIYMPPGEAVRPRPAVLWFHGGGWRNGSKAGAAERAPRLLQRGIVVVGVNYRYSTDERFPAQIHDCKGAIRWLRANAETYNIDPNRIGVWGASSGGHLAALAGTAGDVEELEGTVGGNLEESSRVQAVADYYGHTDFFAVHPEQAQCGSSESRLLGQCLSLIQENRDHPEWAEWVTLATMASPVAHVTADDPPFRILHGALDTVVIPLHSELLHEALTQAGVESHLTVLADAGHGTDLIHDQTTADLLAKWLANPDCTADWNNDGRVNSTDISEFLSVWLASHGAASPGGDYDGDGALTSGDISAYLQDWLEQIGGC